MKLNEIKNRMFSLSDLKGLIKENRLGEKMSWPSFFRDYPQYLDDRYALEKQEQFWPDEELLKAIANYPGSSYSYITDKEKVSTLDKVSRKNIFNAFKNNRLVNMGQKQGKPKKADKPVSIAGFIQNNTDFSGADKPMTQTMTPFEYLEMFFNQNFNGNLLNYRKGESVMDYLDGIRGFANEAYKRLKIDAFNNPNLVWDSNNPSFFLFLLFYYTDHCKKNGRGNRNMTKDYINAIESPEVKEAVEAMLSVKNEETPDSIINRIILNPIGCDFYDALTEEGLNEIVSNYFIKNSIQPIKSLNLNINSEALKKNSKNLGVAILVSYYICNFSKSRPVDELRTILLDCFNYPGSASIIRSVSYRSRYNKGGDIFNNIAMAYGSDLNSIFDPLNSVSLDNVRDAIKKVVTTEDGMVTDIKMFQNIVSEYGNFEIQEYESVETLSPAERFILYARNLGEVLEEKVANKYGSYDILNPTTVFISAGEGLKLMKGNASFMKKKDYKDRCQLLQNIYKDQDRKTENWYFCDLIFDDFFWRDKTQRAVYYFLKSNSDFNGTKWEYEYNRGKKEERVDAELDYQSLDILCYYGNNFEERACFEYEGEQHFHPLSVRPTDELAGTFAVKFYNELKNNILNKYIKAFQASKTDKIWEDIKVYDSIMKEEYNKSFQKLAGMPFRQAYDRVFRGYNLKQLSSLHEAAIDRDYTVDELLSYVFVLLCSWEGLNLPARYSKLNFPDVYGEVTLESSVPYLGSPKRYVEELHVYHQKISDKKKSDILKNRNWIISYIVPGGKSITQENIDEIKPLANPAGAVFRWNDSEKENILGFMKEIGIPVLEKEVVQESLFEEIVKELLRGSNLQ